MILIVVMPPANAFLNPSLVGLIASNALASGFNADELSPPSGPPRCECVSTTPGMIIFPFTSVTIAPAGIFVSAPPTEMIFPF